MKLALDPRFPRALERGGALAKEVLADGTPALEAALTFAAALAACCFVGRMPIAVAIEMVRAAFPRAVQG